MPPETDNGNDPAQIADPLDNLPEVAIEDEDEVPPDDDEQDEHIPPPDYWPTEQEMRDLKITHDNAGHPTNQDFARLLRRGHARPEVANWVRKHFKCPDCEANKRPSARRPAAVPRTYQFNHVVGIDLVKAPNPLTKQKEWWANVICWGTAYQQVWRLGNDDCKSAEKTLGQLSSKHGYAYLMSQKSWWWILD